MPFRSPSKYLRGTGIVRTGTCFPYMSIFTVISSFTTRTSMLRVDIGGTRTPFITLVMCFKLFFTVTFTFPYLEYEVAEAGCVPTANNTTATSKRAAQVSRFAV